jgi:N-methylhydantoinase B
MPGATGRNELNGEAVAGKLQVSVQAGARLTVWTPGGGGWGAEPS